MGKAGTLEIKKVESEAAKLRGDSAISIDQNDADND